MVLGAGEGVTTAFVTIDILERLAFLHSPKSQERALEIPSNKK
jgi:hypothetical protein